MRKKFIIRADGNAEIGAGHIMRCLALAIAIRDSGTECIFVTSDDSFSDIISFNNFQHIVLWTKFYELEQELDEYYSVYCSFNPDLFIVDSYYVTQRYLIKLKKIGKVAYLDDIKAFPYDVDILINYNIFAKEYQYKEIYNKQGIMLPEMILGVEYTPLRKEFQGIEFPSISSDVKNIFFSVGGGDPDRIALNFVKAIVDKKNELEKYIFHLVLGSFEPDIDEIKQIVVDYEWIVVHENVKRMSVVMRNCELAVSAAGSTLYELCACGIPTITFVLENNQIMGAETMLKNEMMIYAGDYRTSKNFFENLIQCIINLCSDRKKRIKLSKNAKLIVDGNGALRLRDKLFSLCGKE